jgi:hypothetical protein
MPTLCIIADGLFQDLVGSLVTIICTPLLNRVKHAVRHAVSRSHDVRVELVKETMSTNALYRERRWGV